MRTAALLGAMVLAVLMFAPVYTVAQQATAVEIHDFAFDPHDVLVAAGSTVRWVNRDDAPHSIAMQGGAPGSSQVLDPGKEHAFTFRQPGRFTYRCGVHPTMFGVVVVQSP